MEGKIIFITGGASGIGRSTALLCAQNKPKAIILGDINHDKLKEVSTEVEKYSVDTFTVKLDVSNQESVENAFNQIESKYGYIDILVNSAGICYLTPFNEISVDEWNSVLSINLLGTFLCCQKGIEIMVKKGVKGSIVNISSIAGKVGGLAVGAHYAASKAGIICLTISAAKYAAKYGIRVNAVAPGTIDNSMTQSWDPEIKNRLRLNIPLGELGTSKDVANAIVFLASSKARYITGEILDVNGGTFMD